MYNSIEPLSLSIISATYDRESVRACLWLAESFWGVGVRECVVVGVCGKKKDVFSFFSILERAFSCCIWRWQRPTVASVTVLNKQWVNRISIVFVFCWTDTTIYYVVDVCVQMDV